MENQLQRQSSDLCSMLIEKRSIGAVIGHRRGLASKSVRRTPPGTAATNCAVPLKWHSRSDSVLVNRRCAPDFRGSSREASALAHQSPLTSFHVISSSSRAGAASAWEKSIASDASAMRYPRVVR